jgi:hypothetical protein
VARLADRCCKTQVSEPALLEDHPTHDSHSLRTQKFGSEDMSNAYILSARPHPTESFCKMISRRDRTRLEWAVYGDDLRFQNAGCLSDDFHLDSSSISLAELIESTQLSQKRRTLLS